MMSSSFGERARSLSLVGRGLIAAGSAMIAAGLVTGASLSYAAADGPSQTSATTSADPIDVKGGHLDWVYPPAAATAEGAAGPSVHVSDGATVLPGGVLRFPAGGGSYDPSGNAAVSHRGRVVLTFEDRTVTVESPSVVINSAGAAVRADLTAVPTGTAGGREPTPATDRAAEIMKLNTYGLPPTRSGRQVSWTGVPATLTDLAGAALTPDGQDSPGAAPAPQGAVTPGAQESTVTVVLTVAATAPLPAGGQAPVRVATATATASVSPSPSASPDPTASACATPTATATATPSPGATPSPSTTAGSTATASPTPSPGTTDCSTPGPGDPGNGGSDDTGSPTGEKLAKTGSTLVLPLMLAGGALVTAGGGSLLAARRRVEPDEI